jgi:hypothetical protein
MAKNTESVELKKQSQLQSKDNEKNEFNDALMEKRANRFKVVPIRTRTGNDMFGTQAETKEELLVSNTTRQTMRQENLDNESKKKDTAQTRSSRIGKQNANQESMFSQNNKKQNANQSTFSESSTKNTRKLNKRH